MSKNYLTIVSIAALFVITAGCANAYTQNTLFGTGYGFAGYNNFSNGAAVTDAINKPKKLFVETKTEKTVEETTEEIKKTTDSAEKNVSSISGKYDEAPNAGYKTKYTYIEKDMSDYNPYTGTGSGVNDSKSIYTDGLGRLHFFGKGSKIKTTD